MSKLIDNLDMSDLQDLAASWNPKEIAEAVEEAMFAYIYSNLSEDAKIEKSGDYVFYLRMLRDAFLEVKPKG